MCIFPEPSFGSEDNKKKTISALEFLLPVIMLIFMVIVVVLQVFMRYVMKSPLSWPEEVTRWCLIWITFVGLAYGAQHEALVRVDFFVKKVFKKKWRYVTLVTDALVALFFLFLTISGIAYTMAGISSGKNMPVTGVPTAVSNIAIAIGAFLMGARGTVEILRNIKTLSESDEMEELN